MLASKNPVKWSYVLGLSEYSVVCVEFLCKLAVFRVLSSGGGVVEEAVEQRRLLVQGKNGSGLRDVSNNGRILVNDYE